MSATGTALALKSSGRQSDIVKMLLNRQAKAQVCVKTILETADTLRDVQEDMNRLTRIYNEIKLPTNGHKRQYIHRIPKTHRLENPKNTHIILRPCHYCHVAKDPRGHAQHERKCAKDHGKKYTRSH